MGIVENFRSTLSDRKHVRFLTMLTTSWKLIPVLLALVVSASFAGTLPSVRSVKITNTRADWFYLEELSILNDAGDDVASVEFGSIASSSEQPGFFSTDQGPIDDIFGACCETGWHSTTSRSCVGRRRHRHRHRIRHRHRHRRLRDVGALR